METCWCQSVKLATNRGKLRAGFDRNSVGKRLAAGLDGAWPLGEPVPMRLRCFLEALADNFHPEERGCVPPCPNITGLEQVERDLTAVVSIVWELCTFLVHRTLDAADFTFDSAQTAVARAVVSTLVRVAIAIRPGQALVARSRLPLLRVSATVQITTRKSRESATSISAWTALYQCQERIMRTGPLTCTVG